MSPLLLNMNRQRPEGNDHCGSATPKDGIDQADAAKREERGKPLLEGAGRHTLSYMKTSALTIRLDPELEKQLDRLAARTGRSRSEIVREALRRQLAMSQFQELRKRMMPFAEAAGYLTDEDVFRDVS